MLARHQRISRGSDFTRTLRRGVRVRRADLQVHAVHNDSTDVSADRGVRFGLIVSKSVGDAVARHAVARRLRVAAATADTGDGALGPDCGGLVVIRALPSCADRSSTELADELGAALRVARARLDDRTRAGR